MSTASAHSSAVYPQPRRWRETLWAMADRECAASATPPVAMAATKASAIAGTYVWVPILSSSR